MDDTRGKPPPLPDRPISLSLRRAQQQRERALTEERDTLARHLKQERALTQMLRNQLLEHTDPRQEDTVPGIGIATPAPPRRERATMHPPRRRRFRMAARGTVGGLLLLGAVEAGADWLGARYPGLMGPIGALVQYLKAPADGGP